MTNHGPRKKVGCGSVIAAGFVFLVAGTLAAIFSALF